MLTPLSAEWILWPVAAHLSLVLTLYLWLTLARGRAVQRGETAYSDFQFGDGESREAARISRNLSYQFEAPVLFHLLALTLFVSGAVSGAQIILAWAFVMGRLIHTGVQTLTDNVRLRGYVFTINYLALIGMWGLFLIETLFL